MRNSSYSKQQSCEIFVVEIRENEIKVQSTETMIEKGFGATHLFDLLQSISTNIAQLCCSV